MSNVSRVKETIKDIDSMMNDLNSNYLMVDNWNLANAYLASISLSLKDISLTLARLCDETEAHNAGKQ